jgi:hypothetical protein
MTEEMKQKLRDAGREDLIKTHEINQSGYAGIDGHNSGMIVDRREVYHAVPVQENPMMNLPAAKPYFIRISKDQFDEKLMKIRTTSTFEKSFYAGYMIDVILVDSNLFILDRLDLKFYQLEYSVMLRLYEAIQTTIELRLCIFRGFADKGLNTSVYDRLDHDRMDMLFGPISIQWKDIIEIVNRIKLHDGYKES